MALGTIKDVGIKGIACAVPTNKVETASFAQRFGSANVSQFEKMTGIASRNICSMQQCVSDLCFIAAMNLLNKIDWAPLTVDALLFVSGTPDYKLPATSCILQHRLGLSEDCIAMDINLGCSGYVYGLWLAATLISSRVKRVLLLVGNQTNINIDPNDASVAMLFGDAGSATAVEYEEGQTIHYSLKTKGEGFKNIIVPFGSARNRGCDPTSFKSNYIMKGPEVFNFTIQDVVGAIAEFMKKFNLTADRIDVCLLHQANLFIMKHLAKKLKIPFEKVSISIDAFGNTSGASLPLTLAYNRDKFDLQPMNVLMSGFGVGLSFGVIYTQIDKSVCFPLIYSDEYFSEGGPNFD